MATEVVEVGEDPRPVPREKINHTLTKLFGAALLVSFCFVFFSNASGVEKAERVNANGGERRGGRPLMEKPDASFTLLPEMARHVGKGDSLKEQCDLFDGKWVPNPSEPAYTNSSCKFIDPPQNCMTNGRPDTEYLHWRWQPYGCDLPPFDAQKFLCAMRNKGWALIGDSIFRNQIESLLCLLSKVEEAVEIYHDKTFKTRTWYFSSHNFTLSIIWAPFLVKAEIAENSEGKSKHDIQLYLDTLERTWTSEYQKYDYIVISGGQWFLKTTIFWENNTVVGCHYCSGENIKELGMDYSYRKALQLVFRFITNSDHKPVVLFRTWTPDHFEHGEWFSGGVCNRTRPYKEGEFSGGSEDSLMRGVEIEEFTNAAAVGAKNGTRLKLLDTHHLSLLRPDGHPGPYRRFHPDLRKKPQNDCLHWCLPGPIDTWNDLVMEMLLNEEDWRYST
ncbi:protein trichome birefringence-like 26 [Typha latifolia]|uniref:protein trichome birefringence-like 26 n=1 Tax=Typha latifolia TaxID=4733 RepID=UPI003C2F7602